MNIFKNKIFILITVFIIFLGGYLVGKYAPYPDSNDLIPLSTEQKLVFKEILDLIENESYFKKEINWDKLYKGIISGMVSSLNDPYSYTLEQEDYKHLLDEAKGYYGGVGLQLGLKNGNKVVIAPFPNTPASNAGVQSGDIVKKVNGLDVENLTLERVAAMIRGEPETKVTIVFKRGESTYEVNLTRKIIKIVTVESKMLNNSLGYLKISLFNEATPKDADEQISELINKGSKYLVMDLRKNPGGLLEPAVNIAKFFVKGDIVSIVDSDGKSQNYKGYSTKYDIPIIIWVDEGTASASEILAGSLQDYDAAILIGRKTFGKGSVQRVWNLKDGSALKLTIAKYKLPSGKFIHGVGLTPDIELPENSTDEDFLKETIKQLDNL